MPEEVKKRRLQEVITTFYSFVGDRNRRLIGTHQLVLVEGVSLVHVYISTAKSSSVKCGCDLSLAARDYSV